MSSKKTVSSGRGTSSSSNQLDLGWRQRVDKELVLHTASFAQPSTPQSLQALRDGGPRRQLLPAAVRPPPPYALSVDDGALDSLGAFMQAGSARAGMALGVSAAHDEAAGVSSAHAWRCGRPPSSSGSVLASRRPESSRSVVSIGSGSRYSLCTDLPPAPSELSARTDLTGMSSRLETLERLFLAEREARVRLEEHLARVEASRPGAAKAAQPGRSHAERAGALPPRGAGTKGRLAR